MKGGIFMSKKDKEEIEQKEVLTYRKLTIEYMIRYIDENVPNDKEWFKSVALVDRTDKNGNTKKVCDMFRAKKAFCERYMPELLPKHTGKVSATEMLLKW